MTPKALALLALLTLQGTSVAHADDGMRIVHPGSDPVTAGAPTRFTGRANIQQVFDASAGSRLSAGYVTFDPGARSAWHTHPAGQLLVIVAGTGWVQEAGKHRQTVHAGDVVWTPPGVKHWHGGTATTAMTQLSAQETVDGRNVDWMEQVTDAQFRGAE